MLESKKNDILLTLIMIYVVASVCMNIFSVKALSFGLPFIVMDSGVLISWVPNLIASIITESYDRSIADKLVSRTTILLLIVSVIAKIIVYIPTSNTYYLQAEHFAYVFDNDVRIVIASVTAFFISGLINVWILSSIKVKNNFKIWLKFTIVAFISQFIDNLLFEVIAFAPISMSLYEMKWADIKSAVLCSTVIEAVLEGIVFIFIINFFIKYIKKSK